MISRKNSYFAGISSEVHITPAMKSAVMSHRMIEFPVSSGNAHRVKEADVPEDGPLKAIEDKSEPKAKEPEPEPALIGPVKPDEPKEPELTEAQKFNNSNPLGVIMFGGMPEAPLAIEPPKPEPEPAPSIEPVKPVEEAAEPKTDKVFEPVKEPSKDISSIVSQRLNAMKKLSSKFHFL